MSKQKSVALACHVLRMDSMSSAYKTLTGESKCKLPVCEIEVSTFLFNKTNRHTNFPNLFWLKNGPLHVSGSSSAHQQEFVTVHLALVYVIPFAVSWALLVS
jgi:hypothetical protein